MTRTGRRRALVALVAALGFAALPVAAQNRVTIRMVPAPNQTLHFRNAQESVVTTETETGGAASGVGHAPMPMRIQTVVEVTTAIGPTDQRGHYVSRMTIDRITLTGTQDGKPMPTPPELDEANKHVVVFAYDDQGNVIDVSVEGPQTPATTPGITQMMKTAFAMPAPMTLAVGESVSVPAPMNLPTPSGGTGINMTGETRYTLTSITFDGADRIAHLTSKMTNTANPEWSPGSSRIVVSITGEGTLDVNIDRGIVVHSEQRTRTENAVQGPPSGGTPAATMRMRSTVHSVSDLVK